MNKDLQHPFFHLLRIGLGTAKADEGNLVGFDAFSTDAGAWERLFKMGCEQGVAAIQFDGLQKLIGEGGLPSHLQPSREVKMKWFGHTVQVERNHAQHENMITRLGSFYASHDIRMMLLKGYGLSLLYPVPAHRPCGDVDIWLFGEQKRADKLLYEELGVKIDEDHHMHTVFHIDGVMVENHYDFLNAESHLSNREVERELHKLLKIGCEKISVGKSEVYIPPVDFNALFLLRHAAGHFASAEIAIRHVTDWALFVLRHHKDINWDFLEKMARKQNMHLFLHCLNGICIDYLGLSPEVFPDFERERRLEERMMQDVLNPPYKDKSALGGHPLRDFCYRWRRWWGNRWKHRMVYREGLFLTFLVQIRSHLMKPKS